MCHDTRSGRALGGCEKIGVPSVQPSTPTLRPGTRTVPHYVFGLPDWPRPSDKQPFRRAQTVIFETIELQNIHRFGGDGDFRFAIRDVF